nr:paraquat-inducible protein A [Ralstonia sp. LMG 19083]
MCEGSSLELLLATAQRGGPWARRERATLYRLVELVGYWSILDALVVAIVTSLVKFGALARVEPRPGILFFGAWCP